MPKKTENDESTKIQEYIDQLNDRQKKAYDIAKKILESSFNIKKSIGYKTWLKNNSN